MSPTFPVTLAIVLAHHVTVTLQTLLHDDVSGAFTPNLVALMRDFRLPSHPSRPQYVEFTQTHTQPDRQTYIHAGTASPGVVSQTNTADFDDNLINNSKDMGHKKWSQMSSWGKRARTSPYSGGFNDHQRLERRWNDFSVWGKRGWVSLRDLAARKRWKQMSSWGKRDAPDGVANGRILKPNCISSTECIPGGVSMSKKWKQMSSWGKRAGDEDLEKRWKQMSVWGKRNDDKTVDKRWKQMSVWGKRNDDENIDKRWKQMSVWGKRNDDKSIDKRWKQMSVWGKRNDDKSIDKRWKQMSVWGKRNDDENIDQRWKQMSVWGKRTDDPDFEKKWKLMSSLGKRADEIIEYGSDKKWKQMSSWGKRNVDNVDNDNVDKRWKQMSSWGKRSDNIRSDKRFQQVPSWGKRWANMASWGKRAAPSWTFDHAWNTPADDVTPPGGDKRSDHVVGHGVYVDYDKRPQQRWRELSLWGKRDGGTVASVKETVSVPAQELVLDKKWDQAPQKKLRRQAGWDMWGKRPSWQNSGFTSWGKRSALDHTTLADLQFVPTRPGLDPDSTTLDISQIKDILQSTTMGEDLKSERGQGSEVINKPEKV